MSSKVLEINDLSFAYDNKKAIFKNFNLTLKLGEVISIVGESGSGKTTLFNLITNELKPNSGDIVTLGNIAQVYQDPYSSFIDSYSIINQIQDVASIENLDFYLQKLNITQQIIKSKPYQLSGGQLQRASILRALLIKPKLLLVDEPTSALDNITSLEVMRLMLGFLDSFGMLLITHDNNLAKWCSDKIVDIQI
jgi:peptide/nickel transport system ATP-binding protein